jgi:hypothetical protein
MTANPEDRREALVKAAKIAHVRPGLGYDEAAVAADAGAALLLDFMRCNGDFALGLLQAASYILSGERSDDSDTLWEVNSLTNRAIMLAPGNPDVLRRAFTIFQRMLPDCNSSRNDIIITDTNWETLPQPDLLD